MPRAALGATTLSPGPPNKQHSCTKAARAGITEALEKNKMYTFHRLKGKEAQGLGVECSGEAKVVDTFSRQGCHLTHVAG